MSKVYQIALRGSVPPWGRGVPAQPHGASASTPLLSPATEGSLGADGAAATGHPLPVALGRGCESAGSSEPSGGRSSPAWEWDGRLVGSEGKPMGL